MLSKKEFKEIITYSQYGQKRETCIRAIFFDWSDNIKTGIGFKYMMGSNELSKTQLINEAYNWMIKEENPSIECFYAFAHKDEYRFKQPLTGNGLMTIHSKIMLEMYK